jgi:REP element-mobilizing transposase RayT
MHDILVGVWRDEATAWRVGRYIVMPDHVHYFAWATDQSISFDNWVKFWKSKFSWAHGHQDKRMQRNDWDRRMRTEVQYEEKWNYVRHNAVRAGLVKDADQWPFQGTVFKLDW